MDSAISVDLHGAALSQWWLTSLVVLMADAGVFLLPAALVVVWSVRGQSQAERRRAVLAGCLAAVVAIGLGLVLERTLARPRPFVALGVAPLIAHAPDSSFPSDHTLVGVALVSALAWRVPRLGLWLLGWALLVGAARVMALLHYPSDILGSTVLGLGLGVIAWLLLPRVIGKLPDDADRDRTVRASGARTPGPRPPRLS